LDQFSQSVKFNFNGKGAVSSFPGFVMTCLLFILLIAYAEKKVVNFLLRTNPNINAIVVPDNFTPSDVVDYDEVGFKLAFSVEQFNSPYEARDDPSYVSWHIRLKSSVNGVTTSSPLTYHKCTDADYEAFSPPKQNVVVAFMAA
jgi:hypothetical protein